MCQILPDATDNRMNAKPGRPRLLRELNDRAALELLGSSGALTRAQVSEMTGLSKVTANHVLSRLEERGVGLRPVSSAGCPSPARPSATAAGSAAGVAFLDELARRIALGVASICAVLEPELVVLGSHVGAAGGDALAGRVQQAVANMCSGPATGCGERDPGQARGARGPADRGRTGTRAGLLRRPLNGAGRRLAALGRAHDDR
ncbi:winged helix-turn-helix transcriptional regulator [Nonomuraea sp. NPDC050451]|uniref:winged helix-turn-helix transcriptional regulator n=1 Tax=Nonomuraea sp. NPDC050451 TaxID=3364364 RepID=UPI00379E9241